MGTLLSEEPHSELAGACRIQTNPLVSAVINYYNEKTNVDFAMFSLARQTYDNIEVILVDDCSTDGTTEEILEKYNSLLRLRVINPGKHIGLRPARNLGVKAAAGQIIVTLDLHVKFDDLFIERIVHAFNMNPNLGAVGCLLLGTGDKWFNKGFNALEGFFFKIRANLTSYKYVFGGAAAFNSKILKSIGYLSENEVTEDEDISWRLQKAGWGVLLLKANIVYHKEPTTFKNFVKKLALIGLRATPVLTKFKSKLIYPQNLVRFFVLPLFLILLLILKPELMLVLVPAFFASFVVIFALDKSGMKKACCGSLVTAFFIVLTTMGFYYGLALIILKRMNIVKQFNVDSGVQLANG